MSKRLIYVEDAIDALRNHVRGGHIILPYEYIKDIVLSLPSAQQKRMRGRWVPVTNGRGGYECDQCHNYAPSYQDGVEWLSDFCPNCGADMRGNTDEV